MSTRANIVVKGGYNKLYFYRHSDGYPEGAMPLLEKFMQLIKDGVIRNDVSQASGWLIIFGAEEYKTHQVPEEDVLDYKITKEATEKWKDKIPSIPNKSCGYHSTWKVGSIEPTDSIHGDVEYVYVLDLEKKTIETYEACEYDDK